MNTKYIDAMLALHGCNQSELSAFLLILQNKIEIQKADNTVFLLRDNKELLANELGIGIRQVERLISKCVDAGILKKTDYRGKYCVDISVYPTEKQITKLEKINGKKDDSDAWNKKFI